MDIEDIELIKKDILSKAELQKLTRPGVNPGDIYKLSIPQEYTSLIALDQELGLEWILAKPHVDDPELWCMVPLDSTSLIPAGTWDISVSDSYSPTQILIGPGVIRCLFMWIHIDDLTTIGKKIGFVDDNLVEQIKQRIAAMVNDDDFDESYLPTVDSDPDYQQHIESICHFVNDFELMLEKIS